MDPRKKTARLAGALYLVVVLTGIFHLMYVPSQLNDWSDASATFNNIATHETLFRLGIFAGLLCYMAFLLLPLVLYQLLNPVNKTYAVLMVVLAEVSVPISFVNMLNKFAVLTLISKASYLSAFDAADLQSQVMLHLSYYNNGNQLASIFWGLWLLPFGYLAFRSGLIPKVLGILLMAGCFGYVTNFVGDFLFPNSYDGLGISSIITIPAGLGEIGTCLWLLIAGIKKTSPPAL
ncbi:MAG TPA: DUF4386 domain-containing protein [Ohtaekwangia sp.]|uniref:DUF4386 domain-containing protein n=1 Tax=Ohtaekwangia sp. TaxID=2066019 RepID=UPI002F949BB9